MATINQSYFAELQTIPEIFPPKVGFWSRKFYETLSCRMNGNENSEERYAYFGRLDLLVINKKWAVKTVHLKIYRLGVNEHLTKKKTI